MVIAAEGYPGAYPKGMEIFGLEEAAADDALVFHGGTQRKDDRILASGGRILGITGLGDDFEKAIARAYQATRESLLRKYVLSARHWLSRSR